MNRKLRISIIGTRGIPARYGGFETFAHEISAILVNNGFKVGVQCDPGTYNQSDFGGADLFFSSVPKTGNQLRYYYEGIKWGLKNSDILLVTGTGGSIFYFLNLFHRKIIITNPDGLEYKRTKWPFYARFYLLISEALAYFVSDFIVADSDAIRNILIGKYKFFNRKIRTIEYGAHLNFNFKQEVLKKYSLENKEYYLIVCRLEPENNLRIILEAFNLSKSAYKLVIVGNYEDNPYGRNLLKKYKSDRVIFTGGIYDKDELVSIRLSCRACFHGHSVGGTNPSLLEAMTCSKLILCHDNVFNREVTAGAQLYFSDSENCLQKISEIDRMKDSELALFENNARKRIEEFYTWDIIGEKYLIFLDAIRRKINKPERK